MEARGSSGVEEGCAWGWFRVSWFSHCTQTFSTLRKTNFYNNWAVTGILKKKEKSRPKPRSDAVPLTRLVGTRTLNYKYRFVSSSIFHTARICI